jgi:hypothetical protein
MGAVPEPVGFQWDDGNRLKNLDPHNPAWDFWSVIEVPVDDLRRRSAIPPLDVAHVPVGEPVTVRPGTGA